MILRLLLLTLSAHAQVQDIGTQTQDLERKRQAQEEAQKAAEEGRARQVSDRGRRVRYEDVLADPDNVELNYRYGQQQIAEGDLKGASATLERILMLRADLPKVKLLYAVVLFRLDNLDDAQRELLALKKEKMPESLRGEIDDYLKQIRRRRRRVRLNLVVGAGFDFDENRNAAPSDGIRLFQDNPVILDANSTRKNDTAATMLASAGLSYDLGYQAGHQAFASLSYYRAEQNRLRTLNLQNYGVEAGVTFKRASWSLTPAFEFSHLLLAETTYQRSRGAGLRWDVKPRKWFDLSTSLSYSRQVYNRTQVVPTGDQRTGDRTEGSFSASFTLTPSMRLVFATGGARQGAASSFNAYDRGTISFTHQWVLRYGQFLISGVTANFDRYYSPETAISRFTRADDTVRARLTYGLPLGLLARPLRDLVWTGTYEFYQAYSNIRNYAYTNNKVSTMATYRWSR